MINIYDILRNPSSDLDLSNPTIGPLFNPTT